MGDPKRPIGSFLLLGPTGVGKTETAKALAEALFSQEEALIRVDMGEYSESHSVARLIGAPPGYIGYDEGGQLTEAVRKKPYSVILFDEIEKAHPEVFKVFLEILDEGHLTDGKGRKVSFKNTLILMTSNAITEIPEEFSVGKHENEFSEDFGKQTKAQRNYLMKELSRWFRPEFLNRVDDIIVYQPLSEIGVAAIAANELELIRKRLASQGVEFTYDPDVAEWIAKVGYDPLYGARPLKRAINREILDTVASSLLGQREQAARVNVAMKDGRVVVGVEE